MFPLKKLARKGLIIYSSLALIRQYIQFFSAHCSDPHVEEDTGPSDHQPFPLLSHALESIDPHVGFNIEIKYCMQLKVRKHLPLTRWIYVRKFDDRIVFYIISRHRNIADCWNSFSSKTRISTLYAVNINGLMLKRRNSSVLAMELRLFCIKSSISWLLVMHGVGISIHGINLHSRRLNIYKIRPKSIVILVKGQKFSQYLNVREFNLFIFLVRRVS